MLNLGGGEVLVILLLGLLILGPERLPTAARQVGGWVRELRRLSAGFQEELRNAIDLDDDDDDRPRRYREGDAPFGPGQGSIEATAREGAEDAPTYEVEHRARNDGTVDGAVEDEVARPDEKPVSPGGPVDLRVVPPPPGDEPSDGGGDLPPGARATG